MYVFQEREHIIIRSIIIIIIDSEKQQLKNKYLLKFDNNLGLLILPDEVFQFLSSDYFFTREPQRGNVFL